jgi:hypothetical protein
VRMDAQQLRFSDQGSDVLEDRILVFWRCQ